MRYEQLRLNTLDNFQRCCCSGALYLQCYESQNHRMVAVVRDLWKSSCIHILLKQRHQQSVPQDNAQRYFEYLREGDSTNSLGNICQCFLMFRQNILCFILCPMPHVLALSTTEKSLALFPLHSHATVISLLHAKQSQLSVFPHRQDALVHYLSSPLLGFLQCIQVSLVLWSPELDIAFQEWPHQSEERGRITFIDLLAIFCLMQPRIPLTTNTVAKAHCQVLLNLMSTTSFSAELLSIWLAPASADAWFSSFTGTGHSLLNFMRYLSSYFFSLYQSL